MSFLEDAFGETADAVTSRRAPQPRDQMDLLAEREDRQDTLRSEAKQDEFDAIRKTQTLQPGRDLLRQESDKEFGWGRMAMEARGVTFEEVWKQTPAGEDWVAEYRSQADKAAKNLQTLIARGFNDTDALLIAAAPGILDHIEGVADTAEWTQTYLEFERLQQMGPGEARKKWDTLPSRIQDQITDLGFDIDAVESQLGGIGQVADSIAGAAAVIPGAPLNWIGENILEGASGTLEFAEDVAEGTAQRGWRTVEWAWRSGWEDGRLVIDKTDGDRAIGHQVWRDAWNRVGDGDNTFRPGAYDEMVEIAGGNRDAVEIARLYAAGKTAEQIMEHVGAEEDDWETYVKLRRLEQNPKIQELMTFAERNKLSPGRAAGQVFDDNQYISGVVDATWRMFADPFLVAGKLNTARKFHRAVPTDSLASALPVVKKRLGTFVDDVQDISARANDSANGTPIINLDDYRSYNRHLRRRVARKEITPEAAAMIELVDHVFYDNGRHLARYVTRIRPGNAALASKVNEYRLFLQSSPLTKNLGPKEHYRLAAQVIHDELLPVEMMAGLGYSPKAQGAFMPRLTFGGYLKAQAAPKMNEVIDWTLRKAPARLLHGSKIGVDDYENAEAFLGEYVRMTRADDVAPTRLEDFSVMRKVLEDKGYKPDVIAHTLTRQVLVDIGVNETHGLPMDALARYAMYQGDAASPVYDQIKDALHQIEDLDESVKAEDLVGAFDAAIERYTEMFAALPEPYWKTKGLLEDGTFNRDLNELTSIFRAVWMSYADRKAILSPEEVRRLRQIYGRATWIDHVANPDNVDTRGLFARMTIGRKDPTGGAASWEEFYEDVIAPLAARGSFRKISEFLRENKTELAAKYDQGLIEDLHFQLSDFRWDDSMQAARYKIHDPVLGPRYIDDPDAYEEQLTGVLAEWQRGEIEGLTQDRAKLQSKINWLTDPMAFQQLGLAAIGKAARAVTLFTRKIPKFGYVPFDGDHALGEFQKFLDMGVYGKEARQLAHRFVNETDAGRRSVLFAAKRQLLHDTGILFNPHAQDFVLSELYEADFYYGGLKWIDNQGHARMSALLPDVQTAGGISIPDIELIAFNADRNRLMSAISPVNGELSYLTKRFNHAFKQAAVFAPRLILRAGGLDESLSVVARHGLRDTTRIYAQSTLSRMRASALARDVTRTSVWNGYHRTGQARMATKHKLPEANYRQIQGLLGNRDSFIKRWEKVKAIERYRTAALRTADPKDQEMQDAIRGLKRFGLDPGQMDEAVSPAWVDDMIAQQRHDQMILEGQIRAGKMPDILGDPKAMRHWVEETELEAMFDARIPVRETTAPGLHDAARWHARFADTLINIGNKIFRLDLDEDGMRAANVLSTNPIAYNAFNRNMNTTIVHTLNDHDPTEPLTWEELEPILRLRDDTGEYSKGSTTDLLGMKYLAKTGQMLSASDLANIPAWGFMSMLPATERHRVGTLLTDLNRLTPELDLTRFGPLEDPYRGGTTRWHRLFQAAAEIEDDAERAFAVGRAYFATAPDSYKHLVWDILTDHPSTRYAEIDTLRLTAEWRDHLRGHGIDPDEFGVSQDVVETMTDFFVRQHQLDPQAAWLVAWNDEAFRPSVAYANANALRAADTGTFFHGTSSPLQRIYPVREVVANMHDHRLASGPGLYLSQNAPYAGNYAYMAQQIPERGGKAVMNRLRLKDEFADHRIMNAVNPTAEDRAELRDVVQQMRAKYAGHADSDYRVLLQALDDALARDPAVMNWLDVWGALRSRLGFFEPSSTVMPKMADAITDDLLEELGRRGYAAFTDHDSEWATATPRLGDAFDPDENRHLVVFLDDVVDVDDPVNFSMTAEAVEAEMLQVDPATGRSRYDDEIDDWVDAVLGQVDPDGGVDRIIDAQYRDLLRPERQRYIKRHDKASPSNDVRYNRSEDFVTIFVPRSKVGHTRLQLTEQQRDLGDQFMADAMASQAVLDGNATPSTYDILGSPDPREAQRLLNFYSNGRPQDWDMVEIVVSKADWEKRVATLTKDDPRVAYVHDPFNHASGRRVPAARTMDDDGVSNINVAPDAESVSDPFRQLFAVSKDEIDQAQVVRGRLEVNDGDVVNPADPGYHPILAGKRVDQMTFELAEEMVHNLRTKMIGGNGVPSAQYLGPIALGRFHADDVQDMQLNLPMDVLRPGMKAARYAEPDGTFEVIKSLRRKRDSGFDMIGRGINELARTPQFMRAFSVALRDAKGFRKPSQHFDQLNAEMSELFGDHFDEMREVLNAELGLATTQISTYAQVKDVADSEAVRLAAHFGVDLEGKPQQVARFKDWAAGELAWQNLETSQAMTAAFRQVAMYIDDTRVRSQFSQLFDVIWPFTYATEQFITRWVNTTIHSPEMFRRMALYYHGLHVSGVITEDENGNDVYEIPFSGALTKGLAWVLNVVPGVDIDPDLLPDTNFTGRIEYTFAGTTDPLQLSAGPTLALPLAGARPLVPDAVIPFEELLISELGHGNSWYETVLPSTLGRFTGAFGGVDHGTTIGAMQYVSAYAPHLEPTFTVNDDGTIDGPTPAEIDEYRMEVERAARVLHLARGITGLFSPAAPQFNLDPDHLSEDFTRYLEMGVPIEEAVGAFLEENPGATAYTIAKTESAGGAPIDPSRATLETINEHREFFDAYDMAGPYLLPHSGGEDDFDPLAWGELQAINYKTYRTGKEWYRAYSFAVGAKQYFPARDVKEQALANADSAQERQAIRTVWKTWTADFFAKYPLFADEVSSQEATRRRANVRRDMRKALDDPLLPESENAEIIRLLLDVYDGVERQIADDTKYDSDQRKAAQQAFHAWALDKVRGNFMAQAFYDRVILRDLNVEDQPFGAGG